MKNFETLLDALKGLACRPNVYVKSVSNQNAAIDAKLNHHRVSKNL